jgi:SAM-dependent methyltransferase
MASIAATMHPKTPPMSPEPTHGSLLPVSPPLPSSRAAERNKQPILEVLQRWLPPKASVLEVASGTGQHAVHFAAQQPLWQWQPSDGDAAALPTIASRCAPWGNVAAPLHLDLLSGDGDGVQPGLPEAERGSFDAVYVANLLHISPWPACAALMRLAATHLRAGGLLVVYGPFDVEGEALAPGNRDFDADLRARDARWGLRRLGQVQAEASRVGLEFVQRVAMPANNLMLAWRRRDGAHPAG